MVDADEPEPIVPLVSELVPVELLPVVPLPVVPLPVELLPVVLLPVAEPEVSDPVDRSLVLEEPEPIRSLLVPVDVPLDVPLCAAAG